MQKDRTEMKGKKEPVARFLKSYVVFIDDHTGKEDIFFDLIENKQSISNDEQIEHCCNTMKHVKMTLAVR